MTIYVYPTDTLWGIGCNIFNESLVQEICAIKKSGLGGKPHSILFSNINDVSNYFDLSKHFNKKWIEKFFSLESTMLISKNYLTQQIPDWITCGSNFVGVRCVSNPATTKILKIEGSPIITTSLNLSGKPPIITQDDAISFCSANCPQVTFYNADQDLSGRPSTIVEFGASLNIIRRGFFANEIESHLGLLST